MLLGNEHRTKGAHEALATELQLPDGHHAAKELRDTDFTTFKQVAVAAMAGNMSTIPLPSNLLLMYQAVQCVPRNKFTLTRFIGMCCLFATFEIDLPAFPVVPSCSL